MQFLPKIPYYFIYSNNLNFSYIDTLTVVFFKSLVTKLFIEYFYVTPEIHSHLVFSL